MRWLFLLLMVLNVFYFGWSQLEAPVQPKEIAALAQKKNGAGDIKLLSEAPLADNARANEQSCLFLGGLPSVGQVEKIAAQLKSAKVDAALYQTHEGGNRLYWLRIAPGNREVVDNASLSEVISDINDLKRKIMPCEGIATPG
ncbi:MULTISPECIES: hypothetical protein [unclassified Pseudomonas]|uniref:hypothetical protein n=1 Tax=unclassified Pseudomonas TaxID=196821 RepID=UPI000BD30BF6|nr:MULTISPECIES: hypothetical protein [unclassified Pseudomonas]PVZ08406.1 hypothetical protein F474_04510 [Pseudomonas sp. URIL14HWK12:I12]PVZ21073.1 hypothetical protein F470_04516 [Pseudomonas sp. URIL14HWK12:I10]PVZ29648.1 hypothetical protein F472_04514 [Pseudomonas sp. URIL14HWK12:I11]SNZ18914.1 hypothetical protein SAMN05660463_04510 [Pseudomonas sp. URIL14HWK12:I9]